MRANRYGKYARTGWFGHTQEHSLAARGIKLYAARKEQMMAPVFLAQRKEESLPSWRIREAIQNGQTYNDIVRENALADKEDIRKRGIREYGGVTANDTLKTLDEQGVDATISHARVNGYFAEKVRETLNDGVAASFLPAPKVTFLKQRIASEVPQ